MRNPPPPPPPPRRQSSAGVFQAGYGSYGYPLVAPPAPLPSYGSSHPTNYQTTRTPGSAPYPFRNNGGEYPASAPANAKSNKHQKPAVSSNDEKSFKCSACDNVSFDSAIALKNHVQTHTTCTKCDFSACPKIIKAHFRQVHGEFSGSGYKQITVAIPGMRVQRFNICVGNRPEDIQQWIADRRKRFPRQQRDTKDTKEGDKSCKSAQPNSTGLSSLLDGYGSSSSEEGEAEEPKPSKNVDAIAPKDVREARSGCSGNSSKPSAASEPSTADADTSGGAQQATQKRRVCRFFARNGTCRNGENCHFLHEQQSHQPPAAKKQRHQPRPHQTGLLANLLANDVRRENMLTLNLLQYIADQRYFQDATGPNEN